MTRVTDAELNASWEATGLRFENSPMNRRPLTDDERGNLLDGRGTKKGAGKKRRQKPTANRMWLKKEY